MELELQGTPLLGLYKHGAFEYSRFREVHLSDALRMALLYKVIANILIQLTSTGMFFFNYYFPSNSHAFVLF